MQFVENEVTQPVRASRWEQGLVIRAHEQQLRHDIVGEQDLRWAGLHLAPGVALHVASVFGEADGKTAARALLVAFPQLLQGFKLRVDQRVHGVNDEGGDAVVWGGLA